MSFNINNVNKKTVIYFSLFGFILSLITGLISGNDFINLIIRSLISGVAIGVVIFICNLVIMIYLPELLDASEHNEDTVDSGEDSDGQVNIVMPEEGYTVQNSDQLINSETGGSDFDSVEDVNVTTAPRSEFKEVDMSNLENLSSLGVADIKQEQEVSESDTGVSSSASDGESIAGEHSVEDMAKAVKTVLKKD